MTRNSDSTWPLSISVGRFVLVLLFVTSNGSLVFSQSSESTNGARGNRFDAPAMAWVSNRDLRRQLDKPIGVTWERVPLREALTRLSSQSGVTIFLDRNVDPNLRITLRAKSAPLGRVLEQLAVRLKLGVAQVGPVVYLGPQFVASRLSTLAVQRNDELRELKSSQAAKWRKREAWSWARLAQPKKALLQLAEDNQLTIKNANRIPFDLWPQMNLPAMTLAERLTLFLAGFRLSYQFDNDDNVRLVRFPAAVSVTREYRLRSDRSLADLRSQFPQAEVEVANGMAVVQTTVEEQAAIYDLLTGKRTGDSPQKPEEVPDVGFERKRFTLRIEDREFVKVMKQLADQIGIDLVVGAGVAIDANELVSIDVENANIDELLDALLAQVGLKHERAGMAVKLLPK